MKRTLLIAALFLGFSVAGYSQFVTTDNITGGIIVDETTGEQMEMIIENPNVTVVPGESLRLTTNGTDNTIVVKNNGEIVCRMNGVSRHCTGGALDITVVDYDRGGVETWWGIIKIMHKDDIKPN
ncbi:MAG: hypothetical protein JKX95_08815 [Bacteroidia bacterium]|nr:hypothetical protein [Bacteroidia bacterium]